MDIKTVQIKGEMLFSETNGKPTEHYDDLNEETVESYASIKKGPK